MRVTIEVKWEKAWHANGWESMYVRDELVQEKEGVEHFPSLSSLKANISELISQTSFLVYLHHLHADVHVDLPGLSI